MTFRTFDEMMDDSARYYAANKDRLERRLMQLSQQQDNLNEDDYKSRMSELAETLSMIEKSRKLQNDMMEAATRDQLTGSFGSNYIRQRMNSWYTESKEGLAVLMWDIDRFKELNDKVDHFYGDNALRLIAYEVEKKLNHITSQHKYIYTEMGRYGGEEFIIGLLDFKTDEQHLAEIADYVREGVASLKLSDDINISEDLRNRSITIAGKIYEDTDNSVFDIIKKYIDKQLVCAKNENRRNSTIIIPRRYIKD